MMPVNITKKIAHLSYVGSLVVVLLHAQFRDLNSNIVDGLSLKGQIALILMAILWLGSVISAFLAIKTQEFRAVGFLGLAASVGAAIFVLRDLI